MRKVYYLIITVLLLGVIATGVVLFFNNRNIEKAKDPQSSIDTGQNTSDEKKEEKLVIFHNGSGPMCIEALEFLEQNGIAYEEHLTADEDFSEKLTTYKSPITASEGVSTSYGYYPYIFVGGKAFSGFDDEIGEEIKRLVVD